MPSHSNACAGGVCLLQVCIQLQMCPAPSLFSTLHRAMSLQATLLGSKFASFSIITTSTPTVTGIATISSSSDSVEDTADSSEVHATISSSGDIVEEAADSSVVHPSKLVRAKAKVHGPGLALPMAS